MKHIWYTLMLLGCLTSPLAFAQGNIVIVVSKKSAVPRLTAAQAKALYLGETRFPVPGVPIELHDRQRTAPIFKEFYEALASMSPKQVTVHWSRKVFTGEASPPVRDNGDDSAIIDVLKSRPEAINYIYEKNLNSTVKVVYSFKDK